MWSSNDIHFYFNGADRASIDDVTGTYTAISDARLKENIKPMETMLSKIDKLNILEYSFIHDKDHRNQFGVLAQDAYILFPELVTRGETSEEGQSSWMVNYAGFSMVALKSIQEQQEMIEKQKKQIIDQQKEIDEIKHLLNNLIDREE